MANRFVVDSHEWDHALLTLPANHVLQSWEWGEVKRRHGWTPVRLSWEEGGRPVAAAQALRRPLPHTPWGVMYVPKGPALDYADLALLQEVLGCLEQLARRQKAIFIKIDPDADQAHVVEMLAAHGWRYSAEQIQFRNTALLDLAVSEESLLAAMKSKVRYNIRLSERQGVTVRMGSREDIPLFYRMYAETGMRDGFLVRPLSYYDDVWRAFMNSGRACMFLAEVENEAVAGAILFHFGQKAWYMYGASTSRHREKMPNYALQWAAIRWAKSVGCAVYDLWGAPTVLDEGDRLWGVWRFKEGLGARFTPHIGAYDYPVLRPLYWAYTVVLPRYLALLRQRHKTGLGD